MLSKLVWECAFTGNLTQALLTQNRIEMKHLIVFKNNQIIKSYDLASERNAYSRL